MIAEPRGSASFAAGSARLLGGTASEVAQGNLCCGHRFTHCCRTTFSIQPRGRRNPGELQQGRSVSHPHPPPPPSSRSSGTFPVFDSALRTARVILRLGMFPYQQLQADDFCRWTDYSSQGCNLVRIPHTGNTQCKGEGGRRLSRMARTKPSPAGTPLAPTRLPRHSGTEAASPKTGAQRSSRAAG